MMGAAAADAVAALMGAGASAAWRAADAVNAAGVATGAGVAAGAAMCEIWGGVGIGLAGAAQKDLSGMVL